MRQLIATAVIASIIGLVPGAASATVSAQVDPGVQGSIERLYLAVTDRKGEPEGVAYWTRLYVSGKPLRSIAAEFTKSPEFTARYGTLSDEQFVEMLYGNVLNRGSDPGGKDYWLTQMRSGKLDRAGVVLGFSESREFVAITGTPPPVAPPKPDPCAGQPAGWSDSGNGVCLPGVLHRIRWCESRNSYSAANPVSTARGAYQFLRSSWAAYGHAGRFGVSQAHYASPVQQDLAALATWRASGTRPWLASKHCWG